MPDDASSNKRPGSKTWLDILGQRMEDAKANGAETPPDVPAPPQKSKRVRFSDLAPPDANTILGLTQEDVASAPGVTGLKPLRTPRTPRTPTPPAVRTPSPTPAVPGRADEDLRQRLQTSEEKCREAEARIAQLQAEVGALRDLIAKAGVDEVAQLRLRLAEAYEIIKAIEQAYLAGECPPDDPSRPR